MSEKEPATLEEQYVQFPMALLHRLPELSGAEIKIILYIQRHTKNFSVASRVLSNDELENGRLRKDGTRMDQGTGLSPRAIRYAVIGLEEKHILVVTIAPGGYRAYGLARNLDQQKVSMSTSQGMQEVSTPAHQEPQGMQKVSPDLQIVSDVQQKVAPSSANSIEGRPVQPAPQAVPAEPTDTLTETSTDTLIDTSMAEKKKQAERIGNQNVIRDYEQRIRDLEAEKRTTPYQGKIDRQIQWFRDEIKRLKDE